MDMVKNSPLLFLMIIIASCDIQDNQGRKNQYTLSDITAENFEKILTPILDSSIDKIIDLSSFVEPKIFYFDSRTITSIDGGDWKIEIGSLEENSTYKQFQKGYFSYYFEFANTKAQPMTKLNIIYVPMDGFKNNPLDALIDHALKKLEFTYKRSNSKMPVDILIQEQNDFFVVSKILVTPEGNPIALKFKLYSKEITTLEQK